ncbi:MAG: Uma2 family endonuclease [Candidatus Eremiobacteraeota bacterium]|nr:Uma2 family endonuclease [Candidatus Eremiobacteraeota bacterium]
MSDMASVYERYRISLGEYHRMVQAGVFDVDARVELVNGELIEMPPIHPPHASGVERILNQFALRLAGRAWIRCQDPITLPPDSEPQPDLVLAPLQLEQYRNHHPAPNEILLAVEVAESTLATDRKVKVPLYARSGIREVWLVNLADDELTVYRDPIGAWYGSVQSYHHGDSIAPQAFPDVRFEIGDLLPRR